MKIITLFLLTIYFIKSNKIYCSTENQFLIFHKKSCNNKNCFCNKIDNILLKTKDQRKKIDELKKIIATEKNINTHFLISVLDSELIPEISDDLFVTITDYCENKRLPKKNALEQLKQIDNYCKKYKKENLDISNFLKIFNMVENLPHENSLNPDHQTIDIEVENMYQSIEIEIKTFKNQLWMRGYSYFEENKINLLLIPKILRKTTSMPHYIQSAFLENTCKQLKTNFTDETRIHFLEQYANKILHDLYSFQNNKTENYFIFMTQKDAIHLFRSIVHECENITNISLFIKLLAIKNFMYYYKKIDQ